MSTACGTAIAFLLIEFMRRIGLFSYLKRLLDAQLKGGAHDARPGCLFIQGTRLLSRAGTKNRTAHPLSHQLCDCRRCCQPAPRRGRLPVMTDHPAETASTASASDGLVLNLGTLKIGSVTAMIRAGQAANRKGIPDYIRSGRHRCVRPPQTRRPPDSVAHLRLHRAGKFI